MNFKDLINSNKENVRNIIRLITKETNEDLEQEVYLKVWKNQEKYVEKGSFKTWINTIAKNVSKDYVKSSTYKVSRDSFTDEDVINSIKDKKATPELTLLSKIRQKRIIEAIDGLRPKFKEVIMLCEIDGYTYEAAAKKLNVPVGTVKSRIYNAKKELTLKLEDLL